MQPIDPETKGIADRVNGYLETSFLPGREFASPADFNTQLAVWLPLAYTWHVRRIDSAPTDLIATDRAAMTALPSLAPTVASTGTAKQIAYYAAAVTPTRRWSA